MLVRQARVCTAAIWFMARGMSSGTTVAANAPVPNPADELQLTEQQIAELREAFGLFDKVLPRPARDPNGQSMCT